MPKPTAAQALYPNLPSGQRSEQPPRGDLASTMFPTLTKEHRAKEAWQARARAEQKARSKRMAADLRAINARLREKR